MRQAIDRFLKALVDYNANRRMAVGAEASPDTLRGLLRESSSETEFSALVNGFYKFFHEGLRDDRAFLARRSGPAGSERAFDGLVNDLRTYYQHIDDQNSGPRARRGREWVESRVASSGNASVVWADCAREFLELGVEAMEALASASLAVRRRADLSDEWKQAASSSPRELVEGVLLELGMAPKSTTKDYIVRQFTNDPARARASDDGARRQIAASLCAGIDLPPLPVRYDSVLDALGVLGSTDARAVLLLAHSVHVAGIAEPRSFLAVTSDTWAAVAAAASGGS